MTQFKKSQERLHVGYFTNTYLPDINGVAQSVVTYQKSLQEMGHNVFVFAQQARGYEDELPFVFRYPSFSLEKLPKSYDYSLSIPSSRVINKIIPSLKLDVIHTHHPILLGQVAAKKAKELDIPLIATFHTQYDEYTHYVPFYQPIVKPVFARYLNTFWKQCNHIVVPSNGIKNQLIGSGFEGGITVIPTGIDLKEFNQNIDKDQRKKKGWQDKKVLISVSRLSEEKNYSMMLDAIAEVMYEFPDVILVLIGDGDDRSNLENKAKQLGIESKVIFLGRINHDEVASYLAASDIFCFTSTTETQGLVTMEAIAAGIPVVAVDATGTRETIQNNKQGLLTENSKPSFKKGLLKLLSDQNLYEVLKKNTKKRALDFDVQTLSLAMIDVYQQAIEDKKSGKHIEISEESEQYLSKIAHKWIKSAYSTIQDIGKDEKPSSKKSK